MKRLFGLGGLDFYTLSVVLFCTPSIATVSEKTSDTALPPQLQKPVYDGCGYLDPSMITVPPAYCDILKTNWVILEIKKELLQ